MATRKPQASVVHEPCQSRSRRTLKRIVEATERLLDIRSFDEITVDEIVQAADVSIGSFYARFSSKEALFPALYARYRETLDASDDVLASKGARTLEERVEVMIEAQVARFRQHRGLLRTIASRERLRRSAIHDQLVNWARLATRRRVDALKPFISEVNHPHPKRAIELGLYFVMAIVREKMLFGDSPHASITPLTERRLISEMTRLLTGYLRGGSLASIDSHQRPRFPRLRLSQAALAG